MQFTLDGLAVFLISAILAGIIIPKILLIAFRKRLFDEPDERKIHTAAVPRLGGIAFMPSIIFSLCFVIGIEVLLGSEGIHMHFGLSLDVHGSGARAQLVSRFLPLSFGLCSMMVMYLVGIADDLIGVRYSAKFIAQIIAACLLSLGGVRIDNLHGMLGFYELPWPLAWGLTILLVVYITNAINLIDGIDGLASGLSGIAMAFYGLAFLSAGNWIYALLAFAGLGTLVPFFYYNVFGNPVMQKKIFMGDTGALTIGLLLSFLAIKTTYIMDGSVISSNIMVVAFAPLAIPCMDVLRVFVHRILRGKSPFLPDKTHIHHKLLALGIPHRLTMITILCTSAALIGLNIWLGRFVGPAVVLIADLVFWVLVNYTLTRLIKSRQARLANTPGSE